MLPKGICALILVTCVLQTIVVDAKVEPGFASYSNLGCYRDFEKRILPNYQQDLANNSPEQCVVLCRQSGYQYAGVENGNLCFCGKEQPSNDYKLGKNECNKDCSGSPKEKCGGLWSINVYHTGLPSVVPYSYVGCYQDGGTRILPNHYRQLSNNSPEQCVAECRRAGYFYAGVEYASWCFCGKTLPTEQFKLPENACKMPCSGNKTEICGEGWIMNIYNTGLPNATEYPYKGCFRDDSSKRILPSHVKNLPYNTPEQCVAVCRVSGYSFAGVENGADCYCGKSSPSGDNKLLESDCNVKCPQNPTEKCGGSLSINIYGTGLPTIVPYSPIGCFKDCSKKRLLPDYYTDLANNCPRYCADLCRHYGYPYAGVEMGTECFCGKVLPSVENRVPDSECNMKCPQNSTEMCGGDLRIHVHFTGLTIEKEVDEKCMDPAVAVAKELVSCLDEKFIKKA